MISKFLQMWIRMKLKNNFFYNFLFNYHFSFLIIRSIFHFILYLCMYNAHIFVDGISSSMQVLSSLGYWTWIQPTFLQRSFIVWQLYIYFFSSCFFLINLCIVEIGLARCSGANRSFIRKYSARRYCRWI